MIIILSNFQSLLEGRVVSPALKAIRRTLQRLSRVISGVVAPKLGLGAKGLARFGKKAVINALGKKLYKQIAGFAIKEWCSWFW